MLLCIFITQKLRFSVSEQKRYSYGSRACVFLIDIFFYIHFISGISRTAYKIQPFWFDTVNSFMLFVFFLINPEITLIYDLFLSKRKMFHVLWRVSIAHIHTLEEKIILTVIFDELMNSALRQIWNGMYEKCLISICLLVGNCSLQKVQ